MLRAIEFMIEDLPQVFSTPDYPISRVRAWLVSDPFNSSHLSEADDRRRVGGTVLDVFQSERPFLIGRHQVLIQPMRPNPTVCAC
jgi:hypothetical protein